MPLFRTLLLIFAAAAVLDVPSTTHSATDAWRRNSHPVEEWTSGAEVGPGETQWGHHIRMFIKTSRRDFAGTVGPVYVTFYGLRANSEKMLLHEGFAAGALDVVNLRLTREIGELQRIKLETNSTDGWLLASLWADIGPATYYFETTSRFLDSPDSALPPQTWDGGYDGQSFSADPVGTLAEAYEPQAPTRATPGTDIGTADEGLLGVQSVVLNVVDRVLTYREWMDVYNFFCVSITVSSVSLFRPVAARAFFIHSPFCHHLLPPHFYFRRSDHGQRRNQIGCGTLTGSGLGS